MGKKGKDVLRAGLGLLRVSREDLERIFDEMKARGEAEEKDKVEFVNKALQRLGKRGRNAAKKIKKTALKILRPAKQKIEALNQRIDELLEKFGESKK